MQFFSNIRSRAGLVALLFALIISLVSAVPIPATESELSSPHSNPSLNGQNLTTTAHHDTAKISPSGRKSTLSPATKALHFSADRDTADDELVRRSVGSKIKKAFQKAGSAIKKGFQKAGSAIKKVAQKVGNGVKTAAKKVGTFMKNTGAKVAKFGLKVVQSVGTMVGKVAGYIPAIGKPIDKAIEGVSKVAGVVSDHIHAKLSKKLQKGMNVMNKANKVMDYIPRRREEEEAFQQRDISEAYYLEERDDISLEEREDSYFEGSERDIYERFYDLDEE